MAATPPPPDPYNYSADPALQQILAADQAARANAQASALAAEKRLAIQLGDAKGIIGDKNTALEAARNPFSTLASLLKGYGQQKINTDETANKNNLYYSGARAKQEGQDAYNYQHSVYDARQNALNALAGIQQNLASSLYGYNQADANAYGTAYQNAVSNAETYGYNPGGTTPTSGYLGGVSGAAAAGSAPAPTLATPPTAATAATQAKPATGIASQLAAPPAAMAGSPAFRALAQARIPKVPQVVR